MYYIVLSIVLYSSFLYYLLYYIAFTVSEYWSAKKKILDRLCSVF